MEMIEGAYLKHGNKLLANTFWGNTRYKKIQDKYIDFLSLTGHGFMMKAAAFLPHEV